MKETPWMVAFNFYLCFSLERDERKKSKRKNKKEENKKKKGKHIKTLFFN